MTFSTLNDQAAGLRQLFTDTLTSPSVHALTCLTRPACVLPWVQALVHKQNPDSGLHTAWVDELDLKDRENWPLPCPVRFDLGQSLHDHLPLSASLQPLNAGLWYALARRLQRVPPHTSPSLDQRLQGSGLHFERVLISANPALVRDWRIYAPSIHHTVVSLSDSASLHQTLDWMARIPGQQVASWRLILTGEKAAAAAAAERVHQTAQALLGTTVTILEPLALDIQSGDLLDLSRQLAGMVSMLGAPLASA